MSLRVRKSIKIMPGVRVNISKSGISTSVGVKGATVNLKPGRKVRATVGVPGTGISYTTTLSPAQKSEPPALRRVPERRVDGRRVGRALAIAIAVLGGLFCFRSWTFGLTIASAGAALYSANSKPTQEGS
jgi:hypothetical protein